MDEFRKLQEQYNEMFDEYPPLMSMGGTLENMCKLIKHCLETGKPVDDSDRIY